MQASDIKERKDVSMYDLIIAGSGPAGLTAAIYAKRADLKTAVIEKNPLSGGQILNTYEVDNYPGMPGIGGFDLGMKFREHADKFETEFLDGTVTGIEILEKGSDTKLPMFRVLTETQSYETRTVILACGASYAKLGVQGEDLLGGKGVSYCATCDGAFFKGKTAVVAGGGDVAVEDAIFLARGCSKVYLVHRRHELRAAKILQDELFALDNVEMVWDSVIKTIEGNGHVEKVQVENVSTKHTSYIDTAACFIAVGIHPDTDAFRKLAECDEKGYFIAGEDTMTSVPGIFAAGDCRKKRLRQIVTAVADGANAVTAVQDFLIGKA